MSDYEQQVLDKEQAEMGLVPVNVPPPQRGAVRLTPSELQGLMVIAANTTGIAGKTIPKGMTPQVALSVMVAGAAFGLDPYTSLRHMVAVNGRIEPDAQLMQGICMAYDPTVEFVWPELNEDKAVLRFFRGGKLRIQIEYTNEQAIREGRYQPILKQRKVVTKWSDGNPARPLEWAKDDKGEFIWEEYGRTPWHTHRMLMLAYNCVKIAVKLCAPDLLNAINLELAGAVTPGAESTDAWVVDSDGWNDAAMPAPSSLAGASAAARAASTFNAPPRRHPSAPPKLNPTIVKNELEAQGGTWPQLFAHIGSDRFEDFEAFMREHPDLDLPTVIRHAITGVDPDTGEVPGDWDSGPVDASPASDPENLPLFPEDDR